MSVRPLGWSCRPTPPPTPRRCPGCRRPSAYLSGYCDACIFGVRVSSIQKLTDEEIFRLTGINVEAQRHVRAR